MIQNPRPMAPGGADPSASGIPAMSSRPVSIGRNAQPSSRLGYDLSGIIRRYPNAPGAYARPGQPSLNGPAPPGQPGSVGSSSVRTESPPIGSTATTRTQRAVPMATAPRHDP